MHANTLLACAALLLLAAPSRAVSLRKSTFGTTGGYATAPGLTLGLTAGQPATGTSSDASTVEIGGFWHPFQSVLAVEQAPVAAPAFGIVSIAPNPASGDGSIRFALPRRMDRVRVDVLDVSGRVVRAFAGATLEPGEHRIALTPRRSDGSFLSDGVYFLRLAADGMQSVRRFVFVR
jgi:hypothetical protein